MNKSSLRFFSSSSITYGKPGCSIVKPVHHTVKIHKHILSPRFPELKYAKNDPRSPHFKVTNVAPDRLKGYYNNILKSDLLYATYEHEAPERIVGVKRREWDGTSEYHLNRPLRKPKGFTNPQPDVKKITNKNIPELISIHINCFVPEAVAQPHHNVSSLFQVQQITGEKPKPIFSKSDVVGWGLRRSRQVGAMIELKGKPMHDFLLTLTELVLPKIPDFKGLSNESGDNYGNLAFGLTAKDVKFFPEIASSPDSWTTTYGLHIIFKTTAQKDSQAKILLSSLGLPFHGTEKHK